jgi:pimeloyl-ACP methyl ester carboxylesterase
MSALQPDDDSFYDVPPQVELKPDGAVLNWRHLPGDALAVPVQGEVWQLLYRTRDNAGIATATVGTLLVPSARWVGSGARPLVSYQVPEDALSTSYAPSYLLCSDGIGPAATIDQARFDRKQVAAAVQRGWAVVVPDYQGPRSEFFGAAAAACGVLDGIRAARSFVPAQIREDAPIGLWGYSGGGFATAAAAVNQTRHAPALAICGIAMGGIPADLNAAFQVMSGQPFSGWIPFGLATLRNTYPQVDVDRFLNESAQTYVAAMAHYCAGAAVQAGPANATLAQFEAWPASLTSGEFYRFAQEISPIGFGGSPVAPVYMYHGTADELLPIASARQLAGQYRERGADVVMVEHEGLSHSEGQEFGVDGAVSFLTKRFAEHRRVA